MSEETSEFADKATKKFQNFSKCLKFPYRQNLANFANTSEETNEFCQHVGNTSRFLSLRQKRLASLVRRWKILTIFFDTSEGKAKLFLSTQKGDLR